MIDQTYEIQDGNGKRIVTLAEYRAELDARAKAAKPIGDALRAGDLTACAKAQAAMRAKFI